jgi:lipopolysaccharide export LptBFGC system permease protein LptF
LCVFASYFLLAVSCAIFSSIFYFLVLVAFFIFPFAPILSVKSNNYLSKEIETIGSIIGNRGSRSSNRYDGNETTRSILNIGDQDQYSNRHDGITGKENDSANTRSKERDDRENSKSRENTNELHHTIRNKNRNPKYHIREEFYSDQGFKQYSQFGKSSDDNIQLRKK